MSNSIPQPVQDLIESLTRLPGVGPKTAQRLTMHLLQSPNGLTTELSDAILELKNSTHLCSQCWHLTLQDPCTICTDVYREKSIMCVVEDPADLIALEKTGTFKGLYHVLHGSLSPIDGIGPEELKMSELLRRVEDSRNTDHAVEEVIIATNPTMEGEATANYLLKWLKPFGVKVTRIARGLPSGADIEYADDLTLTRALEGRHEF
jgi:recombination protein RecR